MTDGLTALQMAGGDIWTPHATTRHRDPSQCRATQRHGNKIQCLLYLSCTRTHRSARRHDGFNWVGASSAVAESAAAPAAPPLSVTNRAGRSRCSAVRPSTVFLSSHPAQSRLLSRALTRLLYPRGRKSNTKSYSRRVQPSCRLVRGPPASWTPAKHGCTHRTRLRHAHDQTEQQTSNPAILLCADLLLCNSSMTQNLTPLLGSCWGSAWFRCCSPLVVHVLFCAGAGFQSTAWYPQRSGTSRPRQQCMKRWHCPRWTRAEPRLDTPQRLGW